MVLHKSNYWFASCTQLTLRIIFLFSWFCHVDDDVYVIMDNLVKLLSKMDPKTEARYIGRAATNWKHPVSVSCCLCITVSIMHISYHNYNGLFGRLKIIKFEYLHFICQIVIFKYCIEMWY